MVMDANQENISHACHEILRERFYRIQPLFEKDLSLG